MDDVIFLFIAFVINSKRKVENGAIDVQIMVLNFVAAIYR